MKRSLVISFLLVAFTFTTFAQQNKHDFVLNNVLQSNMVIQQNKPMKIWGKAIPKENIGVTASWTTQKGSAVADKDGYWLCSIPVPEAKKITESKPQTIEVSNGKKTITLSNILIGDVWFLSGQSNMEMTMQPDLPWHEGTEFWEGEVAIANHPAIRSYTCARNRPDNPAWDSKGTWNVCTPETVGKLSAPGYYFARKLIENVNIPIGLVVTSHGSMSGQIYVSEEALAEDPVVKAKYLTPYLNDPKSVKDISRPAKVYNGMIYPFLNLSLKGILWYQGESNAGDRGTYNLLIKTLIRDWRKNFGQENLPFYYAQVSPKAWGKNVKPGAFYSGEGYALFREDQAKIREENKDCEMIITMDIGIPPIAHYRRKKEVGERFADIALNKDYGFPDHAFRGPKYKNFVVEDNIIKVRFDYVGEELETNDYQPPRHFFVAGDDKVFYPSIAEVRGNEIWLKCPMVKEVKAIRYAFLSFPITNLQNKAGLPAEPFRTDNWTKSSYFY